MRRAFLNPLIANLKEHRFSWLFEQTQKAIVIKYLNKILPKKILVGPTMAILAVTYRCNSRCLMCNLPLRAKGKKEYTTKEWRQVIDQLSAIKTAGIGFTGGEPLLRPDIFELMRYAKDKGISVTLNTNALSLTPPTSLKTLNSHPDNINISLDGTDAKTHDYLRNVRGSFDKTISNLEKLVRLRNKGKYKTTITLVTCVSDQNVRDLSKIASLGAKIGVDKIGFIPLHTLNTPKFPPSLISPAPRISPIFKKQIGIIKREKKITIDNSEEYLHMFPAAFAGKKFPLPCLSGETSITLDPYGQIFACWPFLEMDHSPLSFPSPLSLSSLWQSKNYGFLRQKTASCRACFWNCHSELSIFYR